MIQSSLEHGRIAIKLFHCRVLRGAVLLNKMFKKIHRSLDCFVLEIERSLRVSKMISQEHCSPHKLKENVVTQRQTLYSVKLTPFQGTQEVLVNRVDSNYLHLFLDKAIFLSDLGETNLS